MSILVTGGAGFIGSHTCVELQKAGYEVVIVDNLCNSSPAVLERIAKITGTPPLFYSCDIRSRSGLSKIFGAHDIEAVIHFAGLKAVGESSKIPLAYYDNNISGTVVLCETMAAHDVKRIVFSSSATVYGIPPKSPIEETSPTGGVSNPYGRTKYFIEEILRDVYAADNAWSVALLRYFNPIGAYETGEIGESPLGIPNNLMPYLTKVAVGALPQLTVFGDDYPTPDGTCVRDYIHVTDLALGHLATLKKLCSEQSVFTYNLGTGRGYSVLEIIDAFETTSGCKINYAIGPRRAGDLPSLVSDPSLIKAELGWSAERDITKMCLDSWNWQKRNPCGYS